MSATLSSDKKLIETLVVGLRDQDPPGLHLTVGNGNPKAVGFSLARPGRHGGRLQQQRRAAVAAAPRS